MVTMNYDDSVGTGPSPARVDPRSVRVMIVDDHAAVRRSLTAVLEAAGDILVCGEAAGLADAEQVATTAEPDVAVVDLRLGGESGIAASRAVRTRRPETHVILLTSASDDDARFAAILAGADGYLVKQLGISDLVFAVRTAARRSRRTETASAVAGARSRSFASLYGLGLEGMMDEDEEELLDLVVEGRTNAEIGEALHVDEAVATHRVTALLARIDGCRRAGRASRRGLIPG